MTLTKTYLIALTFILVSCSQQTKTEKDSTGQVHSDDNHYTEQSLDKLTIPKSWTEITLINNEWTYSIPCRHVRELQTINITKVDNQDAVMWVWGTAGQWHKLKKIKTQGDSIVFKTLLPYDTTSVVLFTFKYLDKEKGIARWGADGTYCTFVQTQDTGKYAKIQQPCDDDEI